MLNVDGLSFPMAVKDIPRFEAQNRDFAIHVIAPDERDTSFSILYLYVTLLLLDHTTDSRQKHFVYVKNFSRLVADRSRHKEASHVCLSCLHVFTSERVLKDHERRCLVHKPQMVMFPDPRDQTNANCLSPDINANTNKIFNWSAISRHVS